MKTVECVCDICGTKFEKPKNEYNRRIKLGKTKLYCSLKCSGSRKENVEMLSKSAPQYYFKGGENKLINPDDITKSGLKEFARRVRRRNKFAGELDVNDLFEIWKKQNGKCSITKVDLILPNNPKYKTVNNNYKASIDRKDSNKPYTIDNIQFLSATMNFLKMDMVETDVNEFIEIVKNIEFPDM
jgi:hypothetical protein